MFKNPNNDIYQLNINRVEDGGGSKANIIINENGIMNANYCGLIIYN